MKISPGKLMSCRATGEREADRSTSPRAMPATTDEMVSTSSRFSRSAFLHKMRVKTRKMVPKSSQKYHKYENMRDKIDRPHRAPLFVHDNSQSKGWRNQTVLPSDWEDFCSGVLSVICERMGGTRTSRAQETIMGNQIHMCLWFRRGFRYKSLSLPYCLVVRVLVSPGFAWWWGRCWGGGNDSFFRRHGRIHGEHGNVRLMGGRRGDPIGRHFLKMTEKNGVHTMKTTW